MHSVSLMSSYLDEVGGFFSEENIEAIPYNHWKKDNEWLVLVLEAPIYGAFIPVTALTAREAVCQAIAEFKIIKEKDSDE